MASPDPALNFAPQSPSTLRAPENAFGDLNVDVGADMDTSSVQEQQIPMNPASSALLLVSTMNSSRETYLAF